MKKDRFRIFKYLLALAGILMVFFTYLFIFFKSLSHYILSSFGDRGYINILFLGKGGSGHEAPDLTDSIFLASLNYKKRKTTIVSLPRDIWVQELRTKINTLYYWGKQKNEPFSFVKEYIGKIVGQPVDYVVIIDFSFFEKFIDLIGGIEVDVERDFTDYYFPIAGKENDLCQGDSLRRCRYETLVFKKGKQLMDGKTALKFARSRHAEGEEGTDFARIKRQQKIIEAIKNKLLTLSLPKLIKIRKELIILLDSHLDSDIKSKDYRILVFFLLYSLKNFQSFALNEDFLNSFSGLAKYDYLYVLVPKSNNWYEVHEWIRQKIL